MARDGASTPRDHQPALDGVRGLAVALVLLFHGGFTWMTGGYVGVSVFFTLSGFLITGLLLREHRTTGRVAMGAFYARRVRRLMPASLFCLAAICVAAAFGEFAAVTNLRRDVLAALLQVANWNALLGDNSYAELIARNAGGIGPTDHFWSLSVEEQFYWVWPLVCAVAFSRVRSASARRTTMIVAAAVAVAAAPLIAAVWGPDAAYWATPARLGEILVGAALAVVIAGRELRHRWLPWLGAVGTAVIVAAAVWWPADRGPAYQGWLGVFALSSVALIAGLQVPGPLRTAFSVGPLVHLGRISYGVYLYHWPIFAMLTPRRTGWDGVGLFVVRMALTLAVAELSFHLLEQPIRRSTTRGARVAWVSATATVAVAVVTMIAVPAPEPAFSISVDVPKTFASTTAPATSMAPTTSPSTVVSDDTPTTVVATSTTAVHTGPARVLLVGDSTAVALSEGLLGWADDRPEQVQVASLAKPGCGLLRNSAMAGDDGERFTAACNRVFDRELPELLASGAPEVALVMVTVPDVVERVWTNEEGVLRPGDPRYAARLRDDYAAFAATLHDAGVEHVVWVVPPRPSERWLQSIFNPVRDDEWATFVGTIEDAAALHPDSSRVVRLDEWMRANEPTDGSMRPDGLHLTPAAAAVVMDRFIGPLLLSTAGR
jgi:peptidoglycan/LPS O-acetylase OafA/YrhL